jgi:3-hydroxyisobutyrate dehydrogenase-like beta-hydroxyacid dehydrogenase
VGYALDEARQRNLTVQTASAALDRLKQAIAQGLGDEDFTAVIKAVQPAER